MFLLDGVLGMVEKNKNYIIEITGMSHEGQGVGKVDGFTVFIDGVLEGESAEVKIIKIGKSYAVGRLIGILKESQNRTAPFCEAYKRCGGCSLQHMGYEAQLAFKTNVVRESIRRIAKLEDVVIHDAIGMQNPLKYRNKAQYPVSSIKGIPVVGFYAKRSHEVVDHDICCIQNETSGRIRSIIKEFVLRNKISTYDESSGKGLIRHVMTRSGLKTGEVMVVIVINANDLPKKEKLVEELTAEIRGIKSIILNINTKNTNVILGDKNRTIFGSDTIMDYIGRFKFNISAMSFFQVNPVQTEVLYQKALEYADLTGKETVFDLYCGIGTISLFLSEKAKKVYGVEVVEDAILDARKNAEINGVENVEYIAGEAEKVIPDIYSRGVKADVVVVDPPRKGCDEALLQMLVEMQPERIVYVSCNPSTLARDLGYLDANGYKALEVQPVDMFPHTYHVETIIMMTKCGSEDKK